jgi:CRP-like cAMP-binding protein
VAEIGPGALLGERALLEGGRRTSTLRAVTPCKVAVAAAEALDRDALSEVSRGHRREDR